MTSSVKRRIAASVVLVVVIGAGLVTHLALTASAASDIAGDALYAVAVYLLLVIIAPQWSPWIPAALAAGWCIAVELFQLTGIPLSLGAQFPPARLVFGAGFDVRDLIVYVLAIALAVGIDLWQGRSRIE